MPARKHGRPIACSECFKDEGLRRTAREFGKVRSGPCPSCGAVGAAQLDRAGLVELCTAFFVQGTTPTGQGVFAPVIQVNDMLGQSDLFGLPALNEDIGRLAHEHGLFCFYYGPPLWRFGKPPDEDGHVEWLDADVDYILDNCPVRILGEDEVFYRVQLDVPESDIAPARFCSPPPGVTRTPGRFDSADTPICYLGFDVETCLHESRVTLLTQVFAVILSPARPLRLIDLEACAAPAGVTPFEDPSIWLKALLYRGEESYPVCRRIARRIRERGYDGFAYRSFFQQAAERPHHNLALFGAPIRTGAVVVRSIDTVRLNDIAYAWQFGPVVLGSSG